MRYYALLFFIGFNSSIFSVSSGAVEVAGSLFFSSVLPSVFEGAIGAFIHDLGDSMLQEMVIQKELYNDTSQPLYVRKLAEQRIQVLQLEINVRSINQKLSELQREPNTDEKSEAIEDLMQKKMAFQEAIFLVITGR